jgi:phenylalanyl-tRNA synthetase beta chain
MRAPVSWLAEHADIPQGTSPRALADAMIRIGMEVERVETGAEGLSGPLVVGRVLDFEAEPQKNGKTIRWCRVDVGPYNEGAEPRGIVCGADNFATGDLVVVALPGATLPGGFAITARKTYGHVSDGMICSTRELGIGDDQSGILVLPPGSAEPGADARTVLGLDEAVLDIAVTTDRGYCYSIRGLAREAAAALGTAYREIEAQLPPVDGRAYDITVDDPAGCDQFSARAVIGLDPAVPTPDWMVRRLRQSGMRPISLAVDVTNYVMLETGQPLHAFDRAKLSGPVGVRRALAGEHVVTLDGQKRSLDPTDLVVTDDSGPIALAGVMGGESTEVGATTTDILLEAAHWDPRSIALTARRHRLPSEASRRFERGVDPQIAAVALQRCVDLLVEHGGASAAEGFTVVGSPAPPRPIPFDADEPARVAGMPIPAADTVTHLRTVGCIVEGDGQLTVTPPTWRPDLLLPADLVEEVVRLAGYDRLPSVLPPPHAGTGLTPQQALRRAISRAVAAAGLTEVLSYPFVAPDIHDRFGEPADDPRRDALRLANPLSEAEPELRTSLLPGLLTTMLRNLGRGSRDLALFETGLVFGPRPATQPPDIAGIEERPSDAEIAALYGAVPPQPTHLAAVFSGAAELPGWWGPGRTATWADAVEVARVVARTARAELTVTAAEYAPWHPGRCARLEIDGRLIGHAGELHPRVVTALGLPERSCAVEIDLDAIDVPGPARPPAISTYPPVLLDVALVVDATVPAEQIRQALRRGAGSLLESVRLFDVYEDDERLGTGVKSLAFALRFRAPDRTLTVDEATAARDAAVAEAAQFGARLRG